MLPSDVPPAAGSIGKQAARLRTIGDVAAEVEVEPHVLRFWESKFRQVAPVRRPGGHRSYRPEDVDLLHRIRRLLYRQGYTIKGVQRMLDDELETTALRQVCPVRLGLLEDDDEILRPLAAVTSISERPNVAEALRDLRAALRTLRQTLAS